MNKGISLHIGLNYVDPNAYNGWDGQLAGCINDAQAMKQIALAQGFETNILIDSEATCSAVVSRISQIAAALSPGDMFLLTYSGHGGQLPDMTGEEDDGFNETWVLWDRELLDNELYALWSRFATGVRIFVSSDSCHSGTVIRHFFRSRKGNSNKIIDVRSLRSALDRQLMKNRSLSPLLKTNTNGAEKSKKRFIPVDVSLSAFEKRRAEYTYAANMAGPKSGNTITAQLIYISGCQDNQYSYDGDENGYFTAQLLHVWANGGFAGNYRSFYDEIRALMPERQSPNFLTLGQVQDRFLEQKPYSIQYGELVDDDGGGGYVDSNVPSLQCPRSWGRSNHAPVLTINKGVNPYYYVEIAAAPHLLDYDGYGDDRTDQNFYATWNDNQVSSRLTSPSFPIPDYAWEALKHNEKLYFKVGTTSSFDPYTWENHMVSVDYDQLEQAPCMEIVGTTVVVPQPEEEEEQPEFSLTGSVGRGGANRKTDVLLVQELLNKVSVEEGGPDPALAEDGLFGSKTLTAIEDFQATQGLHVDGLITPTGKTFNTLLQKRSVSIVHGVEA